VKRHLFVVLGLWTITIVAFGLIGYIFASTGSMGQLARESAQTGRDPVELAGDPRYAAMLWDDTITYLLLGCCYRLVSASREISKTGELKTLVYSLA
jgi:hypothetical protein